MQAVHTFDILEMYFTSNVKSKAMTPTVTDQLTLDGISTSAKCKGDTGEVKLEAGNVCGHDVHGQRFQK